MTGLDLKRFRQGLGLTQGAFGERLQLSQTVVSQLEAGVLPVTKRHLDRLSQAFETFPDFLKDVEAQAAQGQAALFAPGAQHAVLTVWRWSHDFDLSRVPASGWATDLVMVRRTDAPLIALAMDADTKWYSKGETVVFVAAGQHEIQDRELLLVQVSAGRGSRTMLAVSHVSGRGRSRELRIEPVSPAGRSFVGDEQSAILRCEFRGRYAFSSLSASSLRPTLF